MIVFLDTNIAFGYTFFTDPWNKPSINVFEKYEILYYSNNVLFEFNKKYDLELINLRKFFLSLYENVSIFKNDISKEVLLNFALSLKINYMVEDNIKNSYIESFWNYYHLDDKIRISDLMICLDNFIRNFQLIIFHRKLDFERKVILSKERIEKYESIANELKENGVHKSDSEIVLDAHDLACVDDLILDFISSDYKLLKSLSNMESLKIHDFIGLREFC